MPPAVDERARRLAAWRAEADATTDRGHKAILLYELGCLFEQAGEPDQAIAAWDEARKLAPTFRPVLYALVRLRERRREAQALSELYATEARVARDPAEEASALVDQAGVHEDFLGRAKQAKPLFERALEKHPSSLAAALMLELHLRRHGESARAMHLAASRGAHVREPVLKRLLFLEAALAREMDGEVDEALDFLRTLTKEPIERWRLLEAFEGIARRHGKTDALREVLGRLAELAEKRGRGENIGQGLSAGSLPPFASDRDARDRAAVLLWELARLDPDPAAALAFIDRALVARPRDPLLRLELLDLAERTGDFQKAREIASALGSEIAGAHAAVLHLRAAGLARAAGEEAAEKSALSAAAAAAPQSPAVAALVQDRLLSTSTPAERVAWLERRAAGVGPQSATAFWQAAQLAADVLGQADRAHELYEQATAAAEDPEPVLREMYGAALRLGSDRTADAASRALVDLTADERERAELLFERYRQRRRSDAADPLTPLHEALDDPSAAAWAADVGRLEAAAQGDLELLARAHQRLAAGAEDDGQAAAHHCAAGRAFARADLLDDAYAALDEARARVADHPYAMALVEEVMRAGGAEAQVVGLLQEAARSASNRDAEPLLLRAAIIARASGDTGLAATLLRDAAARSPKSIAPLAEMQRLATGIQDGALEREALEAIVERESGSGRASRAHLSLAERLLADGAEPERALELLRACFADDALGPVAAARLLMASSHIDSEAEALERLLRDARGHGAAGLRRRLGVALRGGPRESEVKSLLPRVRETARDDRWVAWVSLERAGTGRAAVAERIEALDGLAGIVQDPQIAADLLFEARVLVAVRGGDGAAQRERGLAERIQRTAGEGFLSTWVQDETWCAAEDATTRAERLERRAQNSSPQVRPQLLAALGRAHILAEEPERAVEALREALAKTPDDLASWEAMRVAARQAEAWTELVQACDKLASLAQGEPRARLLEESAVALQDYLGRSADAERRLREALAAFRGSSIAYRRLHAILTERGDEEGLLALVTARVGVVDDPAELVPLLDEQARLRHARGELQGAVESLRDLQVLDPGNAGALALLAETSVRLERWGDAVEALRSLSCVDIPPTERRQARLAASRYAREKLGDVEGALADLRVIDGMGLADQSLHLHTAEVAELAGKHEDAARALVGAASAAEDPLERARYERRAAELYTALGDADSAAEAYLRALEASPTDLPSAEGLAALLPIEDRREVSRAFQAAVCERLRWQPNDAGAMRKLRRSATWCGERDLELRALVALEALDQISRDEQTALDALRAQAPERLSGTIARAVETLTAPGLDESLRSMVALADDAVAAADGIEPGPLGVGRRDVVKDKQGSTVRDEVLDLAAAFEVFCDRFYEGGHDPERIEVVPQGEKLPAWVVGSGLPSPLAPRHRFRIAALAMAERLGVTSLLRRRGPEREALVHAIALAGDASLGAAPAEAESMATPIRKALARKTRRAVGDAASAATSDPAAIGAFARGARIAAWRAGLVTSGDLRTALDVAAHDERDDVLLFWLGAGAHQARSAIGLALPDVEVGEVDTSEATADRGALPASHEATVEHLLEQIVAANPYAAKSAAASLELLGGQSSQRERVALLLQLAERHDGRVRARLSTAAAELLEALGGHEPARELLEEALTLDPEDIVILQRVRALRAREGRFEDVIDLLEREAALPVTPEERAVLLQAASVLSLHAVENAAAAENAARRAFMIRPQSAGLAAWLATTQRAAGKAGDAAGTLERAASVTKDGALGAVWLVEVGAEAERQGDHGRARRLYRQAHRLDADALDAAIGLARASLGDGDPREAGRALHDAAAHLTDALLREAFQVVGARLVHRLANQPVDAVRMLEGVEGYVAAMARVEAARDRTDRKALQAALRTAAEESRRTDRALAWVELAEVRAEDGDLEGALEALREAGQADQTLPTLRVLREELARRTGDPLRLARATKASGHGALAAAARAALQPDALDLERSLLRQAARDDLTAAVLALDAAAAAGDRREVGELLAAHPTGVGAALALADHHHREGRLDEALGVLRRAHEQRPDDSMARRWLAILAPAEEAAPLWLAEARELGGVRAAFAATAAARLFAKAGDDDGASEALAHAVEAVPGYPPALWVLEDRARASGDADRLRELMTRRADDTSDPTGAAEVLIRSALLGEQLDPDLLARAHEAVPDDPVLADLRLRADADAGTAERAGLLARQADGAPADWARALRVRAASLYADGEAWTEAAEQARLARPTAEGGADPFAERLLDRVEPLAGDLDQTAERLLEATAEAPDDISRALAFERYAAFEIGARGDLEAAANPLYGILEQYPGHVASLRSLERIFMTVEDDVRLKEVEERFAALGHPQDAATHARLVARVALRMVGAREDAADDALRAAFDYAEADLWLLRRVESVARASGDMRLLAQVVGEMAERTEDPMERAAAELRLAEAVAQTRSPATAASQIARTARDAPDYPLLDEHLARMRLASGASPEAVEALEAAARSARAPGRASALWYEAGILWQESVGDEERAAAALGEVARVDIGYADVFPRLQTLLPKLGQTARLADLVEAALKTTRGNKARLVELHLLLADLSAELGDHEAAKKSLRTVVTMEPRRADVLERLARVCQAEEDWRGAIDALQRMTRATKEPDVLHPALLQLGDLYQRTRNVPRAEATYKQALELFPEDVATRERLDALRTPRRN